MTVPAFDPVLARLRASPGSLTEAEVLAELWAHGEDGWLREDPRVRPTPWGRWAVRVNRAETRSPRAITEQASDGTMTPEATIPTLLPKHAPTAVPRRRTFTSESEARVLSERDAAAVRSRPIPSP